jgi:spore germination protein YaaH
MKLLHCQFNKQSGPDATSQFKIEFTVDESQKDLFYKFVNDLNKGTELLIMAFNAVKDEKEITDIATESPKETKTRFNKRMHAMINQIASEKQMKPEEIKKLLKDYLIKKNLIKESTAELDLNGYASAIYYLESEFDI